MNFEDVIDLYTKLENLNIKIWIDGGWGVDILLGKQTRFHKDMDIAIQEKDVPALRKLLEAEGYKQIREDNKWNFVLRDDFGKEVDVHSFIFDKDGNVIDGIMYPPASLTGTASINGHTLRCIPPEFMVKFHSGYELKEKDFKDVSAICEKFNIELPQEYYKFLKPDSQ
jgi:lincosamide nucleotidyltransferase A/C/D/E